MKSETYNEFDKKFIRHIEHSECCLFNEKAIIAERDPQNLYHVRIIIPSIDEGYIFTEWARQLASDYENGKPFPYIPQVGSEVFVFGYLGRNNQLFFRRFPLVVPQAEQF